MSTFQNKIINKSKIQLHVFTNFKHYQLLVKLPVKHNMLILSISIGLSKSPAKEAKAGFLIFVN